MLYKPDFTDHCGPQGEAPPPTGTGVDQFALTGDEVRAIVKSQYGSSNPPQGSDFVGAAAAYLSRRAQSTPLNEGGGEPIYQCMCTDDDDAAHNQSGKWLWMDVTKDAFEKLKLRSDVRARIVYAAPAPSAKALTDGQIERLFFWMVGNHKTGSIQKFKDFARAILADQPAEAAKMAAEQPKPLSDAQMLAAFNSADSVIDGLHEVLRRAEQPSEDKRELSHEQKKRIASIVHTDCTLIPGATFYNAAEFAITATLAAIAKGEGND
jgi:hypothetical protein